MAISRETMTDDQRKSVALEPEWGAGRRYDVFEVRDFLVQRCFIYLDPDYAGSDVARYPWLESE